MPQNLLDVKQLFKYFPIRGGILRRRIGWVRAVDGVSFAISNAETLGLVGESGCGKTTVGRTILRLLEPNAGSIMFDGTDLMKLGREQMRTLRRNMQMIFQDPQSSLNPRMTVKSIVGEPLLVNGIARGQDLEQRVLSLLKIVGLSRTRWEKNSAGFTSRRQSSLLDNAHRCSFEIQVDLRFEVQS